MTAFCSQICIATNHVHSISGDSPREGNQQISKTSELQGLHTPQQPLDSPLEIQRPVPSDLQPAPEIQPTICSTKSALASSFHHQTAAPNQHQLPPPGRSTKISISFQFPPQGSSTKSASAFSLHHQAAAPHHPASSKASNQSAVNSYFPATPTSWQPGLLLFRYPVIISSIIF